MTKKKATKAAMTVWEKKFSGYAIEAYTTEWEATLADCSTVYVLASNLEQAVAIIDEHTKEKIITLKNTGKKVWQEEKK